MKLLTLPLIAIAVGSTAPVTPDPASAPAAMPAASPFEPAPDCPEPAPYLAEGEPLKPKRLGDLPPARAEYAVDYHEDGCPVPVLIRDRIGR